MKTTGFKRMRFGMSFRITAISVACVLVGTILVSLVLLLLIKTNMKEALQAEQWARLENIAQGVDEKFSSRKITLRVLAESIPKANLSDPTTLQRFLIGLPSLKSAFDNVSILDLSGNLVANLNGVGPIGKINVSDRDYFKETVASNASVISKPYRNRYSNFPQVAMTQPVHGPDGKVAYVISGSINLHQDNFLGEFSDVKFGQTGYLFIINTDGTVVDHPDTKRILSLVNGVGHTSAPVKKALAGFEGTMEATSSYGVVGLYAYKRIRSTDWILGAIYPTAEAFESIYDLQRRAILYAMLLALLAGLLTATAMRRQLRPLAFLHQMMSTDAIAPLGEISSVAFTNDEIGDIAKAYNASRQAAYTFSIQLSRSEQYLRDILTHAGDAFVGLDAHGAITEWNRQAEETFGWSRGEVMGRPLETILIPQQWRQAHVDGVERFVPTGTGPIANKRIELQALHRAGHQIAVELSLASSFDGMNHLPTAFIRDITSRKEAEYKLRENEKFLRTITDNIPILIGYVDIDERYQFANASYQKFLGVDPKAVLGKSMRDILGEVSYKEVTPHVIRVKTGQHAHFERTVRNNGKESHFMSDYIPDFAENGVVIGFFILVLDITERKRAEIEQAESEQRLQLITDNLPVLISYIDREHRLQFGNAAFKKWLDVDPDTILGKLAVNVIGEKRYQDSLPHIERGLAGNMVRFVIASEFNGAVRQLQTVYIPQKSPDGSTLGIYTLTSDVTAQKNLENQLFELSRTDSLTDLPNRRQFEERLNEALARTARSRRILALMFLDIDHFKAINDALGHAVGDDVLIKFGEALRATVRKVDFVARLAGDEFVVVLEGLNNRSEADTIAKKILKAVARALPLGANMLEISTSIGIAFADSGTDVALLLEHADQALYRAKKGGRNQFAIWAGDTQDFTCN